MGWLPCVLLSCLVGGGLPQYCSETHSTPEVPSLFLISLESPHEETDKPRPTFLSFDSLESEIARAFQSVAWQVQDPAQGGSTSYAARGGRSHKNKERQVHQTAERNSIYYVHWSGCVRVLGGRRLPLPPCRSPPHSTDTDGGLE